MKLQIELTLDFRLKYPDIRGDRMHGFRNRIVHNYFGIDYEIVWSIIENDLGGLINQLDELIGRYENESKSK